MTVIAFTASTSKSPPSAHPQKTRYTHATMASQSNQKIAILSVYNKTGLLDLAKGLVKQNVRLLASGGTSKMIKEAGFPVEYA